MNITRKIKLRQLKAKLPFKKWKGRGHFTEENCVASERIMETLLDQLASLGESASEEAKMWKFKVAVEAFNALDAKEHFIFTDERTKLCELFSMIATKAGIDPKNTAMVKARRLSGAIGEIPASHHPFYRRTRKPNRRITPSQRWYMPVAE